MAKISLIEGRCLASLQETHAVPNVFLERHLQVGPKIVQPAAKDESARLSHPHNGEPTKGRVSSLGPMLGILLQQLVDQVVEIGPRDSQLAPS